MSITVLYDKKNNVTVPLDDNTKLADHFVTYPNAIVEEVVTANGVVEQDIINVSGTSILLSQAIFVSTDGDDTNGTGILSNTYRSIGKAISVSGTLSESSRKVILLMPGIYPENPLTVPEYCDILVWGSRNSVKISANNISSPLFTLLGHQRLAGFQLQGVTNSSGIFMNTASKTADIYDITLDQCLYGIRCSNGKLICTNIGVMEGSTTQDVFLADGGDIDIGGFNCITTSIITNAVHVTNANSTVSIDYPEINGSNITNGLKASAGSIFCTGARVRDVTTGFKITGMGKAYVNGVFMIGCNTGVQLSDTSELSVLGMSIIDSITLDWLIDSPTVKLYITSHITNTNKLSIHPLFVDEVITAIDLKPGDTGFKVYGELTVGRPNKGRETALGEGDSFNWGMLAYTYDGTTFANVTANLIDPDMTSITLPNNNVGTALYLSSMFVNSQTTLPLPYYGFKVIITQAMVGGSLAWEYWDGSNWVELNYMGMTGDGNYTPVARNIFNDTITKQVRFDDRIDIDWSDSDPVSLGTNHKWVRIRINSQLTTSFSIDQIKLHPSRTEINEDGFIEFFGKARPIVTLPITYGSFDSAANSPDNADIYLSDTLGVGMRENKFKNYVKDRTGFTFYTPLDIDTSCPIRLRLGFTLEANLTGNINLNIRFGYSSNYNNDKFYNSTGSAPTTHSTELLINKLVAVSGGQFAHNTTLIEIPVVDLIPERANANEGDLMFITIERDASHSSDTYNEDIIIGGLIPFYTSCRVGGHVNNWR